MLRTSTVFRQKSETFLATQAGQVVTDLEETPQDSETETSWSIILKWMAAAVYFLTKRYNPQFLIF